MKYSNSRFYTYKIVPKNHFNPPSEANSKETVATELLFQSGCVNLEDYLNIKRFHCLPKIQSIELNHFHGSFKLDSLSDFLNCSISGQYQMI